MDLTDNVLTVTGPADVLGTFLEDVSGENGLLDFTSHLPEPPVDDGCIPSWWEDNAVDARLVERGPEQLVVVFRTTGWPPLEWANALEASYSDLQFSLLFGDGSEEWAGLWFADENGVGEEWVDPDEVGYPAMWRFVHERGWDFGWSHPEDEDRENPLSALPYLQSIMIRDPYDGPERLVAGGRTWAQRQVLRKRVGVVAFFQWASHNMPDRIEQLTGLSAAQLKFELSADQDLALARLAALDGATRVRFWKDRDILDVLTVDVRLYLEQSAAFWNPHGSSPGTGRSEDRAAS